MDDEDIKRISKRLSYWLRHAPQAAGLTLDDSGWTGVDEVLAALGRGAPMDRAGLEQVVAENDKQRFEISADGCRIRARQGHSVAVEADWPQADPPALLYHGTVERFVDAIMVEGLKPMARHHVHLSPDRQTARVVGARRGKPVVLEVEAGRLAETGQPFFRSGNGVWLTSHVPPGFLRRVN
jgi:putative RNA 2'-phosphotransferase